MRKINILLFSLFLFVATTANIWAGNRDRAGQAGATELLINPWGQSGGFHGMNSSTVKGIEAMRSNVGGLAFLNKTQVVFANSQYLKGSDISINAFGFAQRIGEGSVIGLSMMSMGFGEIPITTIDAPEGNSGATFRPQLLNVSIGYARSFSESIHVGFMGTLVNESISDVKASGICMDMGIQYVTGKDNNMHFGIALRNIGTPMRFSGDGMAIQLTSPQGYNLTAQQRSEKFEMPSQLNIGAGYDFLLAAKKHRITLLANFTSNSFTKDFIGGGLEYAYKEMFMLRGGYRYENGISGSLNPNERSSAYTGLSAGVSVNVPLKKDGPRIGVDYSFRASNPYQGTHTLGVRLDLAASPDLETE